MKAVSLAVAVLALSASVLSGCAAIAPSATKADADKVLQQAARYERTEMQSLGASESNRKPLRGGQWVALLSRSKSDPNDVTLQIMKVGRISGNSVTMETELYGSTNQGRRHVMQHTIENFPLRTKTAYAADEAAALTKSIEISNIRMMDDQGRVVDMPQLPFGMGQAGSDLLANTIATGEITTGPCSSNYYRASKCYLVPFSSKMLWMSDTGTTYAHSAIPIVGLLRSESQKQDMQVIGFGEKGAELLIR